MNYEDPMSFLVWRSLAVAIIFAILSILSGEAQTWIAVSFISVSGALATVVFYYAWSIYNFVALLKSMETHKEY